MCSLFWRAHDRPFPHPNINIDWHVCLMCQLCQCGKLVPGWSTIFWLTINLSCGALWHCNLLARVQADIASQNGWMNTSAWGMQNVWICLYGISILCNYSNNVSVMWWQQWSQQYKLPAYVANAQHMTTKYYTDCKHTMIKCCVNWISLVVL